MEKILIVGANGQLGTELCSSLAALYGASNIVAADIRPGKHAPGILSVTLDVLDTVAFAQLVSSHNITHVYQLAAMLSATGEKFPLKAWNLNMQGLINTLELARDSSIQRVFWPSSIAAFGPNSPRHDTPQLSVMDPTTMYGISKQAGERICEYYHAKYGVDVRSIRYPGVISYVSPPGGGTTDYAIEIFQAAKRGEIYKCFLSKDTMLPMIYMPDALRATLELMQANTSSVSVRSSYNVAGLSFSPLELSEEIQKTVPGFKVIFQPDFRQAIAQGWPQSLDDQEARQQWGWKPQYNLAALVQDMLQNIPLHWFDCSPQVA